MRRQDQSLDTVRLSLAADVFRLFASLVAMAVVTLPSKDTAEDIISLLL